MSTEDELRRLGQTAAALMGVAAARAKQVAEELLGSGDKAREETKHHAGAFFEGGRYAAADVVSALRREAAVVLRDLEHLEENLRYRQSGGASAGSATASEPEDEAPKAPSTTTQGSPGAAQGAPGAADGGAQGGAQATKAETGTRKTAAAKKAAAPQKATGTRKATSTRKATGTRKSGGSSGATSGGQA